jgi:RNA polymerase sigma factor (TIGR02999 family)
VSAGNAKDGAGADDPEGADALIGELYRELRAVAARLLSRRAPGQSLQPTDLVHELYLRMEGRAERPWNDRAHFLAIAARAMRQVLVEHARRAGAAKRGEGWNRVTLAGVGSGTGLDQADLLDLEDALRRLFELDPRQGRIVELRTFGGLTLDETAGCLELSTATVEREWAAGRAWLLARLRPRERSR